MKMSLYENEYVGGTHLHMNGFARNEPIDTEAEDNSEIN